MPQQLRAAIVGTGFMGAVHARAIGAANSSVHLVAARTTERARALADTLPGSVPASFDDVLSSDVDIVHICTPNHLHAEMAHRALAAGKHVVCEKPLAVTVGEAAELRDLAASTGLVATVPFVYRYHAAVRLARTRIAADASPPWLLHGSYLQDWLADPAAHNWRLDTGTGGASRAFGDIGIHWCDLVEFATGQRITSVQATLGAVHASRAGRPAATEDGGVIAFRTDAEALGSLVISQVTAGRKNRLTFSLDGPDATYVFDQENPEALWIGGRETSQIVLRDPGLPGGRADHLPPGHPQGYRECFADFVADTHDAIRGGKPDGLPTFEDGLRAARITAAVLASHDGNSQWTEIPA
ncbi:Gfo/Idh/MocA family protein [Streptomyces sp. NBC_00059]|uniref:Gfo/Idh/MocA family protein n=1 Tax=Streptomyces sp. NBC_00059 TaxID=2975635 RepID=UPI00225A2539|nr:Gfo/Idh/MocA family oxidoreductase [Streptomyces sp. NBC_00059]MCX5412734.1 Gfo/Idh/MocA family oxidoreductase [Streptomyces sp. NBC_00059]